MEFAYELTMHEDFDAKTMKADGILAQNPVVIGAKASLASGAGEETLLTVEGASELLHLYPAKKENAVNVVLKNTAEEDTVTLTFKVGRAVSAELVTPQEEVLETLNVTDGQVTVKIPSRRLVIVRVTRE